MCSAKKCYSKKSYRRAIGKRGVTALVAIVLMIVIVLGVVGMIYGLVIRYTSKLEGLEQQCKNLASLGINEKYTCKTYVMDEFNVTHEIVMVSVNVPSSSEGLSGIAVKLNALMQSKAIVIEPGISTRKVWIPLGNETLPVILPEQGQSITYALDCTRLAVTNVSSVAVAAVVGDTNKITCAYSSTVTLPECVEKPQLPPSPSPPTPPPPGPPGDSASRTQV